MEIGIWRSASGDRHLEMPTREQARTWAQVVCSCRLLNFIAVLAVKLSPTTMLDSLGAGWAARLGDALMRQPAWWLLPGGCFPERRAPQLTL